MSAKISPLAPANQPELPPVEGVRLAVAETGVKYKNRADLLLAVLSPTATIAGCFTTSKTASAPVDFCKANLDHQKASAIIVNAGNANAFTGKKGESSTAKVADMVARILNCPTNEVYMASTGVIGEALDPKQIIDAVAGLVKDADKTAAHAEWSKAAKAIMTTDTFAKQATISAKLNGRTVTINGIAKGSGMIAPDMATMLVFLFSDASLPADISQQLLTDAVNQSFNNISVDSDTSTSDTVLLCTTGQQATSFQNADDPALKDFRSTLNELTRNLAHQVVRDGEGAEKFITITVTGAETKAAARKIGLSIANSPLVKTAIAGADANWGRIVMAVGKAGEKADRDALSIKIGGIQVASNGEVDAGYDEADLVAHMASRAIDILVDVGIAEASATVWTCDLTHRYIEINADYRS